MIAIPAYAVQSHENYTAFRNQLDSLKNTLYHRTYPESVTRRIPDAITKEASRFTSDVDVLDSIRRQVVDALAFRHELDCYLDRSA